MSRRHQSNPEPKRQEEPLIKSSAIQTPKKKLYVALATLVALIAIIVVVKSNKPSQPVEVAVVPDTIQVNVVIEKPHHHHKKVKDSCSLEHPLTNTCE